MKVYRITDHGTGEMFYVETKPHVRRYKMLSETPELITVEEFEYDYKWQIVVLLNDALKTGVELQKSRESEAVS